MTHPTVLRDSFGVPRQRRSMCLDDGLDRTSEASGFGSSSDLLDAEMTDGVQRPRVSDVLERLLGLE